MWLKLARQCRGRCDGNISSWRAQVSTTSCRSRFAEAVGAVTRRSVALAVYLGQSARRRVRIKGIDENRARAGSGMLINICGCFLQSGSAPLQFQQPHSRGVSSGILPTLYGVQCARSRQRPILETVVFYFRSWPIRFGSAFVRLLLVCVCPLWCRACPRCTNQSRANKDTASKTILSRNCLQ